MNFSIFSPKEIIKNSKETFKRFPLAMLSAIIGTFIIIYFINETDSKTALHFLLIRVEFVAILATALFASIELIKHKLNTTSKYLLFTLSFLMLIGYFFTLPKDSNSYYGFEFVLKEILLFIMFFISILWSPFVFTKEENKDYWQYANTVLSAFARSVVFSAIIIIGITFALVAIHKLFHLHISDRVYSEIDAVIVGIFTVGYFLSQLPKEPENTKFTGKAPAASLFFTKYVLTPLTVVYFLILYAYSFKIIITQQWPQNILAWTIVAFSIVAILTYLYWTHHTNNLNSKFRKLLWLAIGIQSILLFVTVGMRISSYSWTQSRYMVVMFGVWLLINSIYFIFFKNAKLKAIFITLSALIAISQVGPFSSYSVSLKAQSSRLSSALTKLKKYPDAKKAPESLRYNISDNISYLSKNYGIDALEPIMPKIIASYKKEHLLKDRSRYNFNRYATSKLGFEFMYYKHYKNSHQYIIYRLKDRYGKTIYKITGYDYLVEVGYRITSRKNISATVTNSTLVINQGVKQIKFDLEDIIKKIDKKKYTYATEREVAREHMTFIQENKYLKAKLVIQYIQFDQKANKDSKNRFSLDATVLLKLK